VVSGGCFRSRQHKDSRIMNSRALLSTLPALALVACSTTTTTTPMTQINTDLQLLANGLSALLPFLPASAGAVSAQVQTTLAEVQRALAATPTPTTIQGIGTLITNLAPAVIGLFPGGGTAVTVVGAIVALLPTIEAAIGLAGAEASARATMTPAMARGVLATLPKA
jgi:hypothetical protein